MNYTNEPKDIVEKIRALMEWGTLEIIPEGEKEDGNFSVYTILYKIEGDDTFEMGEIRDAALEKALDKCIERYNNRLLANRGIVVDGSSIRDFSRRYKIQIK